VTAELPEVLEPARTAESPFCVEGGLLSRDLLERISSSDRDLDGGRPEDYHLAAGERLGEATSRAWLYLQTAYRTFRERLDTLPRSDSATPITRERWLLVLLNQLGFGRVPFVRGGATSHQWEHVPIHLLGWNDKLDRANTAKSRAPESMLQEHLNASEKHLWAILSNGRLLRVLRSSTSLVGGAYLQFDLEAIFDGGSYGDFAMLYALCHESRFELLPRKDDSQSTPEDCWLEKWRHLGIETGERARKQLREGVKRALGELGEGFLRANRALREMLSSGNLKKEDFRHELLRLIYQMIFLFVAEDRQLLLLPDAPTWAADRYRSYFSMARLRRIARKRMGDTHADIWCTLVAILNGLGSDDGLPALGLPALGGLFFRIEGDLLRELKLQNYWLLNAIRYLDEVRDPKTGRRQRVNYAHLGAEELGSVYESLLEEVPQCEPAAARFWLETKPGNLRKKTGTYFTNPDLIGGVLDTALQPVLESVAESRVPADLLQVTVCDPACGSGGFLVAAGRRIAQKYAALVAGDEEPPPNAVRDAMRKVVAQCLYGVDVSPLAAEVAKFSLWIESQSPGRPLAYFDSHIKAGNSLLGATPALLERGLPDDAFTVLAGDNRKTAAQVKKRNARERGGQQSLLPIVNVSNAWLTPQARAIASLRVESLSDIREQARRFQEMEASPELHRKKRVADAWCAAFAWPHVVGGPDPITTNTLLHLEEGGRLSESAEEELERLSRRYQFFHWQLEFPEVFRVEDATAPDHNPVTGWQGGFTCIVGNPPWERVKVQEKEFFADIRPEIAGARNAAVRKRMIEALEHGDDGDPDVYRAYRAALRESDVYSHLVRHSGRYPRTGRGDINTYQVFAETSTTLVAPTGRTCMVLPPEIAVGKTTSEFFSALVDDSRLVALAEFENEEFLLSRDVDHRVPFCWLSVRGRGQDTEQADFSFGARRIGDVATRRFTMQRADLLLVNPNTGTAPLFRSRRDAKINFGIYRRIPVLWRKDPESNPWSVSFMAMFHMANDSGLFHSSENLLGDGWTMRGNVFVRDGERMLPLYEAKMIHHFDHRWGTYEGQTQAQANVGTLPRLALEQKTDPDQVVQPRYWLAEHEVDERLATKHWDHGWLLGWRDITSAGNERTFISSALPHGAAPDGTLLMFPGRGSPALLLASLSSLVLDYAARQKSAGTHLKYFIVNQLPVLPPERYDVPAPWQPDVSLAEWIQPRVLELTYTAWDIQAFARDVGDDGQPFIWDEERRFVMQAELDAAYFHLYGIARDDVDYIMDSFGAFRRNDPARFDRTKAAVLDIYDGLATGEYHTMLDPPPGHGLRHLGVRHG
jgi:hypothetical protein